ncbi:MAG: CBS domain-containing protein [Lentilitoribacter sp.]|jgi:CBS domain-containing protein
MTVKQILDEKGYSVSTMAATETIAEAIDFLAGNKFGAVVVSSKGQEVAGILSERDIVRTISENGKDAVDYPISKVMTKNVKTCKATTSVMEVMEIMTKGGFRHIPIVDEDKLIGIISIRDVIKHRMNEVEREAEEIKAYIGAG